MDKKLFETLIEQVADIEYQQHKISKRDFVKADDEFDDYEEEEEEYEPSDEERIAINQTKNFILKNLKPVARECSLGCGDMVINQRVESKYYSNPIPHWRTKCINCKCYVSPDGKGFVEGTNASIAAFDRYYGRKK
jgi:hypothetical protein